MWGQILDPLGPKHAELAPQGHGLERPEGMFRNGPEEKGNLYGERRNSDD